MRLVQGLQLGDVVGADALPVGLAPLAAVPPPVGAVLDASGEPAALLQIGPLTTRCAVTSSSR
ncbi:hypothetical protein D3093_33965 (plasmid) [Azospirillum argentinense]|uniref:Uncharacterized protein n=1 Tax=Azospirillum argentinense TaxID=2970906 RepID=A0A4D8PQV6_9PROT|nr:hypothetical protein [Azospirillum argentinense]QCO00247.1 hypothetical protein D3093_33965 [Azospirillum argentinense]